MVKFNLKFEQKRVSTGPYATMKYIEYISQTSDTPWWRRYLDLTKSNFWNFFSDNQGKSFEKEKNCQKDIWNNDLKNFSKKYFWNSNLKFLKKTLGKKQEPR